MAAPIVSIRGVTKAFGDVRAVDNVSLDIMPGEFFVLLGPSGCGKTTLLRMIGGFEQPTAGSILIDGKDMAGVQANRRPVNMLFQSYAVFPHMTVTDNVGYGLRVAGVAREERRARVADALALVKLSGLESRKPDQLSGGQRQRVALARALIMRPKVLLLDEPLSALDAKLRAQMQFELAELQACVGITFVTVTHDQDEALSMASRVAVMNRGAVAQTAAPSDLYEFPASRFVADFVGSVNLFEGRLIVDAPHQAVVACAGLGDVHLDRGVSRPAGAEVCLALRPEKIDMGPLNDTPRDAGESTAPERNVARGTIRSLSYRGDITLYEVTLADGTIVRVSRPNRSRRDREALAVHADVRLSWESASPIVLLS